MFDVLASERNKPRSKFYFGIPEAGADGGERFRIIEGNRSNEHSRGLIVCQAVPRCPSYWPALLRWRHRGVAYDTRTGAGLVRRAYVELNPLQRVRALRIDK